MTSRYSLFFSFLLMALLAASVLVYFSTLEMTFIASSTLAKLFAISLLALLIAILIRFVALIWFSYLAHLEDDTVQGPEFTPGVTILVPAYNEGPVIRESISSLLDLDYPNYEILVIDDGSTDNTYALASQFEGEYGHARVRVVTKENSGKANSLNVGIDLAENDYVLCMDGDSKLVSTTVRSGIRHFVDEHVGAVAGNVKVINRNGILTKLQALEYIEGINLEKKAQGFLRIVNIVPGAIGIFRRDALLDVGCYDDDTFAEDCDVTVKLVMKGWRVKYEPGAVSYTEAPEGLLDLLKQRYRWTRGILQTIRKHRRVLFRLRKGPLNPMVLWYMIIGGFLWPLVTVLISLLLVAGAIVLRDVPLIFIFWAQVTLFEMIAALHTVAMEKEDLRLVPYAFFYTLFFILIINISKTLSSLDELLGLKMTWGKVGRLGRL